MTSATRNARERPHSTGSAKIDPERHQRDAGPGHSLAVAGPYIDRHYPARPYAVTSRIGSISRTERHSDRRAAAHGADQTRRDLALLAARLDGRR